MILPLKTFSCDLRQAIRCNLCTESYKMLIYDFMVQAEIEALCVSLTHQRILHSGIYNTHTQTQTHTHTVIHIMRII